MIIIKIIKIITKIKIIIKDIITKIIITLEILLITTMINVMKVIKDIPADANIIGIKWVFAEKDNKKKKARLVALGCQQVPGEDFIETYSTVQSDSVRLIVAIASKFYLDLNQLDIKAAYLNANLKEYLYKNSLR